MHRWKFSALAAATLASVALYAPNALALALGPITVQSALGEPLRAEIALPSITTAEAETLKVGTAPAETFRAQGMEYAGAVSQIQIALQKRPGGQSYLRVSSSRPVSEPFVDLIIDATWATGRITRSYTMLFDPPALRRPAAVAAAPQLSKPAPAVAAPTTRTVVPAAEPRTSSTASASTSTENITVKTGDTAGRIASANRPQGVSLDQMLVAMLRANPGAFINGNVNLVKAGAVLQMPDAEQAGATSAAEARKTIAAQSRDFNSFRRKMAAAAPDAQASSEPASRVATGKVQTEVKEDTSASVSPDKLTLSKGAVKGTDATPEALAKRKQTSEASARVEELAKNINELNKLSDSAPATTAGSSATSGSASGATPAPAIPAPGIVVAGDSPVTPPAATPATEPSTTVVATAATDPAATVVGNAVTPAEAPAPAATPVTPPVVAPVAPSPEPSFMDSMLEDPKIPLLLALLLALGYGGYRYAKNRRDAEGVDSSFLESRLQPDSFFGSSGGQQVDTSGNVTSNTGSSLAFSHSQLDAGGDVDPVAEADVYLAYGRDLQAEEILKEAVRQTPDRLSVHTKLADIYAKRKDAKSLEATATEVFRLTEGQGPEWNRLCDLGREVDPENRYYQPGGQKQASAAPELTAPSGFAASNFPAADYSSEGPPSLPADLEIDLDLSSDTLRTPLAASSAGTGSLAAAALASAIADVGAAPTVRSGLSDQQAPVWTPPTSPVAAASTEQDRDGTPTARNPLEFTVPSTDTQPAALTAMPEDTFAPSNSGLMEFDLTSVSLDLEQPTERVAISQDMATTEIAPLHDSPFATKLALAREFAAIGDNDGARTLLEEVVAESSGDLNVQARSLLAALN